MRWPAFLAVLLCLYGTALAQLASKRNNGRGKSKQKGVPARNEPKKEETEETDEPAAGNTYGRNKGHSMVKRMEQMLEEAILSFHKTGDSLQTNDKLAAAMENIVDDYKGNVKRGGVPAEDPNKLPQWMESIEQWERDAVAGLKDTYPGDIEEETYAGYDLNDDANAKMEIPKSESEEHHGGTYGEIRPRGILNMFRSAGAKPGDRFVDIGSGTGKINVLAWFSGLDSTGIEMSSTRCRAACEALKQLPADPVRSGSKEASIRFVMDDIMNVDFSDSDIVFANSVLMPPFIIEYIINAASQMKVGAKLIVYESTKVNHTNFKLDTSFETPTTWFPIVKYDIYKVTNHDSDASKIKLPASRPTPLCEHKQSKSQEL